MQIKNLRICPKLYITSKNFFFFCCLEQAYFKVNFYRICGMPLNFSKEIEYFSNPIHFFFFISFFTSEIHSYASHYLSNGESTSKASAFLCKQEYRGVHFITKIYKKESTLCLRCMPQCAHNRN